jgi:hypothetical protein
MICTRCTHDSLQGSQVGAIHTLYLHSAMSDMSLPTSALESYTTLSQASPQPPIASSRGDIHTLSSFCDARHEWASAATSQKPPASHAVK